MSAKQDIRGFFSKKNPGKVKRKRDEEEEDDDFQITAKKPVKKKNKKGAVIYDSDSDSDADVKITKVTKAKTTSRSNGSVNRSKKATPPPAAKKKPVDPSSFFGSSPIQKSAKKTTTRTSNQVKLEKADIPKLEIEDHSDEDFTRTLEDLDEKESRSTASKLADKLRKSKVLAPETPEPPSLRRTSPRKRVRQSDSTPTKGRKEIKIEKNNNVEVSQIPETVTSSPHRSSKRLQTPEKSKADVKTRHPSGATPKGDQRTKTPKREVSSRSNGKIEVGVSPPDTAEKKKGGGPAYRSYLQREGPRCLGERDFPEGQDGCLEGLSFVFTGMIEYFDKDELKHNIERLGGVTRGSISKKTSYVVIGREPGESKTQKAQDLKIKTLDEEGFYKMVTTRPGKKKAKTPVKPSKATDKKSSNISDKPPDKPKPIPTQTLKGKDQFSWNSQRQSQGTDSQGSEGNSQESLGRPDTKDGKTVNSQSQPSLQMWVDKYKPNNAKQIIGQQGDKSNAKKLARWLDRWHDNNFGPNKAKARFNRDEGYSFKAALLSGPPGVGKTTTAQIVCKERGFAYFEMNASDARSKKTLKECVSEYLGNTTIGDFFNGKKKVSDHHKHCLIMDEIDGMSGNEDRGGIQEVISLIKGSHIPIICICNDRSHPKIRSLCNHCFDLRFQRPRLPQIKSAMMSVAFKEGVRIPPSVLENMILASNQDVRQVLHNMSMWAAGAHRDSTDGQTGHEAVKKDFKLGPWDVLRQVFSSSGETKKMSFNDKVSLFFHDYSIAPLFVQENYPNVIPHKAKGDIKEHLDLLSQTADSIAYGDLVDKQIRSTMKWNLLPLQAVFASVLPGEYMRGHLGGMINFPSWLGKNSSRGKSHRMLQEIQTHMRMSAAVALQSVNQEYLPRMRTRLTGPLLSEGAEGVEQVVEFMNDYDLTREDFDNILELTQYPGMKEPMKGVPPKVKSAFTRTFNKSSHLSPYAVDLVPKGKSKKGPAVGFGDDAEIEGEAQEGEEENDTAIIAKLKAKASSKGAAASKKGKGPAKGKGKGKGKK